MENASKALIIAGEVLIGVLVLGLIAYMTVLFGGFSANMNEQISQNRVTEFNNNFLKYNGRIDITSDEIVSVINFARQSNENYDIGLKNTSNSPYYVDVIIDGVSIFNAINESAFLTNLNNFKKNNTQYYMCNVSRAAPATRQNVSGKTKIQVTAKTGDIQIDDSAKGTGLVTSIRFSKTRVNNITDFNTTNRDNYIIE